MGERAVFIGIVLLFQAAAAALFIWGLRLPGKWSLPVLGVFVLFNLPLPYLLWLPAGARQPGFWTAALIARPAFAWQFNWLTFMLFLAPIIVLARLTAWIGGWPALVVGLRWGVLCMVGFWSALTVWGLANTVRAPGVNTVEVKIPGLPVEHDGLRLVQLTDPHVAWWNSKAEIARIGEIIADLKPDLFVLTGDMVDHHPDYVYALADGLEPVHPKFGRYAIIGNHDVYTGPEAVAKRMNERGFRMIRNECVSLSEKGPGLSLLGIDDSGAGWTGPDPWEKMIPHYLKDCAGGAPVILLAHRPSAFDQALGLAVPLTLTGHTHGGQLRLPFGGPGLADITYERPGGLYRVGDQTLYANRGSGTVGWPFRLFCPAEVALIILRASSDGSP